MPFCRTFSSYSCSRLIACLALLALCGCTPDFNWREVRFPEHGINLMLPGKPDSMTRRIQLDGMDVDMTMFGAQAGGNKFAVGVIALAPSGAAPTGKALAAMRGQMLRNIGGTELSADPVMVKLVDAGGELRGVTPGLLVDAQGSAQGKPVRMLAGFVGHRDRVYQYLVIGPQAGFRMDEARLFADSIRLVQPGQQGQ